MKATHRWFSLGWMGAVYAFLYLPIFVLILFSFNSGRSSVWQGFSTEGYEALMSDSQMLDGLWVSLRIALISATLSAILGTLIAFVLTRYKRFKGKALFGSMASTPLVMPEVVLGLSLLVVFKALIGIQGGFLTIILGHTLLGAAYAAVVVQARMTEVPKAYEEAALDLGAKPLTTFFLVTLPLIAQSILSGWLLVFTISFDDVVISQFLNGPGVKPLPTVIFESARYGAKPVVNAVGALIVLFVSTLLIAGSIYIQKREKRIAKEIAAAYRDAA